MYYSLYNWIGGHEIAKLKKIFASNPEKRTQKKAQKDMNEMNDTKWTILLYFQMDYTFIFSAMRMRKRHLFGTSSHHNAPYEKQ